MGYCEAVVGIRERFGLANAIEYVVGEKLMTFSQLAESDESFRAELPAFCERIRCLFTRTEIQGYFESAEQESAIEADLLEEASEEEAEELRDRLAEEQRDRERRSWVKAMVLKMGS
jgi:ferredoxin